MNTKQHNILTIIFALALIALFSGIFLHANKIALIGGFVALVCVTIAGVFNTLKVKN